MAETLISVQNVSKKFCRDFKRSLWYGVKDLASELSGIRTDRHTLRKQEFWAIKDVSFEVKQGEVLGLIGPNGAGKTTMLKLLNGLIKLDEGRISVRGRVGALIALGAGFNPILTGRENIYINAAMLGIPKKEIDQKLDEIIDFSGLEDFIDTPVQSYSSGMTVRLGFSVAMNLRPDVMLIDEVLAVGDLAFKNKCMDAIRRLRESGAAFLFVSHSLGAVSALCDKVIYLKDGQITEYGTTERAISTYLTDAPDEDDRFRYEPGTEQYLVVQDVQLLDQESQPVTEAISGHPITIRLKFEAVSYLDSPLFSFDIMPYGEGLPGARLSQQINEDRVSFSPGFHTLDIRIRRCPLLAGRYRLKLTVFAPDILTKYARDYTLGAIDVIARRGQLTSSNNGLVDIEADWIAHTEKGANTIMELG